MPSPRKRIGFLPSEEVHEIIEKLCKANEFSQLKVTGLLVEEALRSRGVLNGSFGEKQVFKSDLINFPFIKIHFLKKINLHLMWKIMPLIKKYYLMISK